MRNLSRLPVLVALLSALCLMDCGGTTQTVLAPRREVPASLLTCAPQPEPPATLTTDTDLTDWVQALADAGQDCRSKLGHVGEIVNAQ